MDVGRGAGRSAGSASPTPATPCCRRRSRCGRSSCSAGCCPGTWRSSTGSTRSSWPRCARPTRTTSCGSAGCRSSQSTRSARSGWRYLATVAGAKVNGVAELHSQLLRDKVLSDFSAYWPDKFTNVTNGVTPRRFIALANPALSELITDTIGDGWLQRPGSAAPSSSRTPTTRRSWTRSARSRRGNEARLADLLERRDGIVLTAGRDVRRDGQAAARVQAADAQAAAHRHAVPADLQANPDLDIVPRVFALRREGGARATGWPSRPSR